MDGLPFLLRNLQSACEQFLFFQAEELIVCQFVLASARTLQESKMQRHDILFVRIDTVEDGVEVMKRVVVADHDQHVSRPHAQSLRRQVVTGFEIELIEFRVFGRSLPRRPFGYGKDREKNNCEANPGDRRYLLGEKIDETQSDERQCDQAKSKWYFHISDREVEWHAKFAF